MVFRVMKGQNLSGLYGFWVSKPGFDVRTADVMQMAFSCDVRNLALVATGQISIAPVTGPAPFGSGTVAGAAASTQTVSYGRTITIPPFAVAIATASSWQLPLAIGTAQLGYLASQWHSQIFEQPPVSVETDYGVANMKRASPPSTTGDVDFSWCSCRFTMNVYNTGVDFVTNCRSTVTVKYLILEGV